MACVIEHTCSQTSFVLKASSVFFFLAFTVNVRHIFCHFPTGWGGQSGWISSGELKGGKALTRGTASSSDLVQLFVRVPRTETPFLSPGLTATTGLSWPQHMGPHMLMFTHSCWMELTLLHNLLRAMRCFPFAQDMFRLFKNVFFPSVTSDKSSSLIFLLSFPKLTCLPMTVWRY